MSVWVLNGLYQKFSDLYFLFGPHADLKQTFAGLPACLEAHRHKRVESTHGLKGHQCILQHLKVLNTRASSLSPQAGFLHLENTADLTWLIFNKGLNIYTTATPVCRLARALYRPTPVHRLHDKIFFPPPVWSVLLRLPSNRRHLTRRLREQAAAEPHICTPLLAKHTLLQQNQSQSHSSHWNVSAYGMKCERLLQMRSCNLEFHYTDQLNQF